LASASVCWGIRIHGRRRILMLFGAALFLMVIGKGFGSRPAEIALIVPGAMLFCLRSPVESASMPKLSQMWARFRMKSVICPSRILGDSP
jgi:hypothetical protein